MKSKDLYASLLKYKDQVVVRARLRRYIRRPSIIERRLAQYATRPAKTAK